MKVFFGWWIVLGSTIVRALSGGLNSYAMSAFFLPLVREFGASRAALSGAVSLSRIEAGLIGPAEGYLADRLGPRKIMFAGVFLMGLGFILMSKVSSLLWFYVVYVTMITLGSSIGISYPAQVAVANWFVKRRGIALGIAGSGVGIGAVFVIPLTWVISTYGWRGAAVAAGIIIWGVGFPIALIMRHRPEQYGMLPDGEPGPKMLQESDRPPSVVTHQAPASSALDEESFTIVQALTTRAFWLIAIGFPLRQMVTGAVVVHQIPFLESVGYSTTIAATILGSLGVVSVGGRFGFAWLADYVEKRYIAALCCFLLGSGMLVLVNVHTTWQLVLLLLVYAPGYGGLTTMMPLIKADYFGRKAFGMILGVSGLIQMVGTVVGPLFAGWVWPTPR